MGQVVGLNNYKFGNKNNWRRWAWNRMKYLCEQREGKTAANSVILYLAGPKDLDREVARLKGFKDKNLIAVDFNEENLKKIRMAGYTTVCGDIAQILNNWSSGLPVDGILFDFCGCCSSKTVGPVLELLENNEKRLSECGVLNIVVNLQRGREDKESFDHIKWVKQFQEHWEIKDLSGGKHRGLIFFVNYLVVALGYFQSEYPQPKFYEDSDEMYEEGGINHEVSQEYLTKLRNFSRYSLFSYKSENGLVFDSVAFSAFSPDKRSSVFDEEDNIWLKEDVRLKRKISAVLANRTRKINN